MNTHVSYFVLKWNACGAMGLFVIQKCIIIIRMLAYGMATNECTWQICLHKRKQNYGKLEVLFVEW
jgi:hypothetical protein